jgi:rSAM/selenodomain-associated transferase 2
MRLSLIVPTLDEGDGIEDHLVALASLRACGVEVVVVDGGSSDDTVRKAQNLADRVLDAPRGRARQMNAGAAFAQGGVLLFLHADTRLPPDGDHHILSALAGGALWGRFDVRIKGRHRMLGVIAWFMNRRSRLTGIATGDQAIFVRRDVFERVGGYPDIPLMEDIALSRTLRRLGAPACLAARVTTSGRRWEERGVWRTVLTMWRLRLAFFFGADPHVLALAYGDPPRDA